MRSRVFEPECPRAVALAVGGVFSLSSFVVIEPAPFDLLCLPLAMALAARMRPITYSDLLLPLLLMLPFAFFNVVSAMFATNTTAMMFYMFVTFYLMFIGLLVFRITETWPGGADVILIGFSLSLLVSTILSVFTFAGLLPISTVMYDEYRVEAFFKDPNVYAPSLIISILFLISLLERPLRSTWKSLAIIAGILLLVVGIIFAASRAAWINFGVSLAFYIGLRAWQTRNQDLVRRLVITLGLFGLVAGGCLAVISFTNFDTFLAERARLQDYDIDRFSTQQHGAEMAYDAPLGIGPGQFESRVSMLGTAAHSLYVRALLENGIFGFISLCIFLLATLFVGFRSAIFSSKLNSTSALVVASLVGVLVNSAFIDTLHWRSFWIQVGLAWGLHAACVQAPAVARPALHSTWSEWKG